MEESKIYDLLSDGLLSKLREKIEETENDTCFFVKEREVFSELEKQLNEQQIELLKSYSLAIENKLDYIYYNLNINILNIGIKIGMDLQKAFAEYE